MTPVTDKAGELTLADLRRANVARREYWGGSDHWTLADWSNAVAGEVGEACNLVKKIRRPQLGTIGNDANAPAYHAALHTEIGDVLIYLDLLAKASGASLDECVLSAFNGKSEKLGMPVRLTPSPPHMQDMHSAVDGLVKALNRIACFSDLNASDRLERTGSYGSFDEPGSVQIAREALAAFAPHSPPDVPLLHEEDNNPVSAGKKGGCSNER